MHARSSPNTNPSLCLFLFWFFPFEPAAGLIYILATCVFLPMVFTPICVRLSLLVHLYFLASVLFRPNSRGILIGHFTGLRQHRHRLCSFISSSRPVSDQEYKFISILKNHGAIEAQFRDRMESRDASGQTKSHCW